MTTRVWFEGAGQRYIAAPEAFVRESVRVLGPTRAVELRALGMLGWLTVSSPKDVVRLFRSIWRTRPPDFLLVEDPTEFKDLSDFLV